MFWSKKEDKRSLPDLPPLNRPRISLPSVNEGFSEGHESGQDIEDQRNELPSFPDNMNDKGFSQAAIKGAVGGPSSSAEEQGGRTIEMEEWHPEAVGGPNEVESHEEPGRLPAPPGEEEHEMTPSLGSGMHEEREVSRATRRVEGVGDEKNKDIFVKLDKFYSARKTLVSVQDNLEDVDELLKKIREVKIREEQELQGWEKELQTVKARLNEITLNLFEKVD